MNVSIVQFSPQLGNIASNIEQINLLLKGCTNSDLIILPELANSGYNFQSFEEAFNCSVNSSKSDFIDFLKDISFSTNSGIICGINERVGKHLFNSAVYLNDGKFVGLYRKLHLFADEFKYFEPGDVGLPIFNYNGLKFGILICFDWAFPEIWRYLALKDVNLVCHPSNLVLPYAQNVIPSYSIINRIYIATANRIGTEHGITFSGNSIISDPDGNIAGQLSGEEEGILTVKMDIEKSKNKMLTHSNHIFNDRRLDVYSDLGEIKNSFIQ